MMVVSRKNFLLAEIKFVYKTSTDYLIEKLSGTKAQKSQGQELQYQNSLLMKYQWEVKM